jgi:hypothetical protein
MTTLSLRHHIEDAAPAGQSSRQDDPQLAEALARLKNAPDVLSSLTSEDWDAIRANDAPEVSGSMAKRRRA